MFFHVQLVAKENGLRSQSFLVEHSSAFQTVIDEGKSDDYFVLVLTESEDFSNEDCSVTESRIPMMLVSTFVKFMERNETHHAMMQMEKANG